MAYKRKQGNKSFLSIVDEELTFFEESCLNGGLVGKALANKLCGYHANSNYIYVVARKGKISRVDVAGGVYFSAIDCLCHRKHREKIYALRSSQKGGKKMAGPRKAA